MQAATGPANAAHVAHDDRRGGAQGGNADTDQVRGIGCETSTHSDDAALENSAFADWQAERSRAAEVALTTGLATGHVLARHDMDCRWVEREGVPFVEFSWDGDDEGDQVCGRGWAAQALDGTLSGRLFFHMGDDSNFRASPFPEGVTWDSR